MTKSQLVKSALQNVDPKVGSASKFSMIVTNHTDDVIGGFMSSTKEMGGRRTQCLASMIVYLSKKKKRMEQLLSATLSKFKTAQVEIE